MIGRRDGDELRDRPVVRTGRRQWRRQRCHAGFADLGLQALQVLPRADRAFAERNDDDLDWRRTGWIGSRDIRVGSGKIRVMACNDEIHSFTDLACILHDRAGGVGETDVVGLDIEARILGECGLEGRQIKNIDDVQSPVIDPEVLLVMRILQRIGRPVSMDKQDRHSTGQRRGGGYRIGIVVVELGRGLGHAHQGAKQQRLRASSDEPQQLVLPAMVQQSIAPPSECPARGGEETSAFTPRRGHDLELGKTDIERDQSIAQQ